jgi:glycosyltransferase involved in cell wall biosynthesis
MKPAARPRVSSISAVFPAYNDAGTIASMVLVAIRALQQETDDYEIIVVNDGSRDHTALVLDELSKLFPKLQVIHHPTNQGYGGAVRSGFAAASKDWVFYTDGDWQYDPLELSRLVEAMRPDVDVVNGYKLGRGDPLYRKIIGRLYHHIVRLAFGFRLRDVDCDFRLIRRTLFERIPLESQTGTICVEMVKKFQDAGCVFAQVPVHHYWRPYGKSQFFNWRRLLRVAGRLAALWWKLVVRKEHLREAHAAG